MDEYEISIDEAMASMLSAIANAENDALLLAKIGQVDPAEFRRFMADVGETDNKNALEILEAAESLHEASLIDHKRKPVTNREARILIADDADSADLLRQNLVKEGYIVDTAATGAAAIETLDRFGHQIVVCDLHLPDMNGMDVLRHVKDTYPSSEVIMMTDYRSVERAVEVTKAGAFLFLEKPFDFEVLMPVLESALERHELMTESESRRNRLANRSEYFNIIGSSKQMPKVNNMSNEKDPNRELAKQRLNMGKDPGGYYSDLSSKYRQQQAQKQESQKSVGSGRAGCFPSGTMISTPSGRHNIASIQPGDYVFSVDIGTGQFAACRVLSVRHHSARTIWRITFEDGHQVRTTSVHSFRITDGWKKASRVCPGDKVLFYDAHGLAQVKNVTGSCSDRAVEDVFNLIVEDHFNFVAEGALAHSFTYFRWARVIAWRILTLCFFQTTGALGNASVKQLRPAKQEVLAASNR